MTLEKRVFLYWVRKIYPTDGAAFEPIRAPVLSVPLRQLWGPQKMIRPWKQESKEIQVDGSQNLGERWDLKGEISGLIYAWMEKSLWSSKNDHPAPQKLELLTRKRLQAGPKLKHGRIKTKGTFFPPFEVDTLSIDHCRMCWSHSQRKQTYNA